MFSLWRTDQGGTAEMISPLTVVRGVFVVLFAYLESPVRIMQTMYAKEGI